MRVRLAIVAALGLLSGAADAADRKEEPTRPKTVKFELVPSGHFIVKVKLNGHGPFNLIFDTGAPATLITPRIARIAKLADEAKDRPPIPIFGMLGQVKVRDFQVGDVLAHDVSAMILDHPTVKAFSDEYENKYGKIDGIVGFPFFARFRMTVDYSKQEMTFVPSGYEAVDVMQDLMQNVMNSFGKKPEPRFVAPAGLWGLELGKESQDDDPGVTVKAVLKGGPAEAAGLKPGDRLLTIDGRWTDSLADAYAAAGMVKPGKPVPVLVRRDGKDVRLTVTPKPGL